MSWSIRLLRRAPARQVSRSRATAGTSVVSPILTATTGRRCAWWSLRPNPQGRPGADPVRQGGFAMSGTATGRVISADGTTIVFDRSGAGPPVILVHGAFTGRAHRILSDVAAALAPWF